MVKANYLAWHINATEFSHDWPEKEKLRFFARYAILAPSGHNTQPWRFSFNKQTLLLKADYNRRLPYSGVQANEPFVSLGACLETLRLAARGFGYELAITYILQDATVAMVAIHGQITPDPTLLDAITKRVSNRHPYELGNLPKELLDTITNSILKDASTHLLSSREDIEYIAKKTEEATYRTFGDKEFRTELSKWVRNNVTKQHDGMPGFVQGIPTPPSLLAKHIIKHVDVSKAQAKKDSRRVLQSAGLLLVVIKDSGEAALLDGGRLYAQICILAQQQGIATTGVGTAVIDSEAKTEIIKKYKLAGQPIAIIRFGRATKEARHTPRWPIDAVTD